MEAQPLLKRYNRITIFTVMLFIICFTAQYSSADDWPQWRGPDRNGVSNETGWSAYWSESGPEELWRLSVGTGYSSVIVVDNRLYTMGNIDKQDIIYCLDATTGKEIWKHSYPAASSGAGYPGPASTPAFDHDRLYIFGREGHLVCLDANSGEPVWSKHSADFGANLPEWGFASSPLVYDNMVIVDAGMTLALNKSNGNLIWKTKDYGDAWDIKNQGGGYSAPVVFDFNGKKLLAVFNSSGLTILDPNDGSELMQHPWKTAYNVNAATPIIKDDKIFISSGYNVGGALLQVSENGLSEIWKNKEMRNHFNSCVLWNDYLYGFDESEVKCLDWNTGQAKWGQRGYGKGSLMIADGKLIIMSDKGKLAIAEASPEAFKELSSAKVLSGLCWTVPVLANGKIYCRNHDDGELVCLNVKN
ncbi:PQQ-binding-like beta-propeller repeat protein [Candidatus Poribacteria bacterium]|nr:PQQ-binding-like beta-propeller repeat protein [Candidatus Poribacteria bacterium]